MIPNLEGRVRDNPEKQFLLGVASPAVFGHHKSPTMHFGRQVVLSNGFSHILSATTATSAVKEIIQPANSVDGMKSGAILNAEWNKAALRIVLPQRL